MLRPDIAGRARHSYFAYGSNLCVGQMAQRCPGAVNPRPAMLADHDWLINERGVATVEPFDGSQLHGVGWQVTAGAIAERAAEAVGASVYVIRHPDHYPHHLPSALSRAKESEQLAEFLDHVEVAVSLHGYGRIGRSTQLLAGGRNRALADHLSHHVNLPGYQGVTDLDAIPLQLGGLHPANPRNPARAGGTHLELSPRVRG